MFIYKFEIFTIGNTISRVLRGIVYRNILKNHENPSNIF